MLRECTFEVNIALFWKFKKYLCIVFMKLMDWNGASTVILRNQVFYSGMSLFSLFYELLFHQYRHKYTSNEVELFFF